MCTQAVLLCRPEVPPRHHGQSWSRFEVIKRDRRAAACPFHAFLERHMDPRRPHPEPSCIYPTTIAWILSCTYPAALRSPSTGPCNVSAAPHGTVCLPKHAARWLQQETSQVGQRDTTAFSTLALSRASPIHVLCESVIRRNPSCQIRCDATRV